MPRKRQVGRTLRAELRQAEREREELNRIGVALSSERDVDKLLELILQKSREITGADAGSLYLIEESAEGERQLRFKLTQNDSRQFPFREAVFALTENSTAGYAALHGEPLNLPDAYRIPRRRPYRFDESYDEESGYRTRSLLSLPMKNPKGEVLGILQLINCKRRRGTRLKSRADVERAVQAFPEQAVRLAMSLASQAAVALENSKLYDEIAQSAFERWGRSGLAGCAGFGPAASGSSAGLGAVGVTTAPAARAAAPVVL